VSFSFDLESPSDARITQLQELISDHLLSNTEREMLRKLAEKGGPLWLVQQGMLAYSEAASYNIGKLDLEDEDDLERGRQLVRERKYIEWQKNLWERLLSSVPETKKD